MEDVKIKISALWLIGMLTAVVWGMLGTLEPGIIQDVMAGKTEGFQITSELLLVFAVIYLIPLLMAFLSLTLKDSMNRWANTILGIFFIGLGLLDLIDYHILVNPQAYAILLGIAHICFKALIVWYAWKWPKKGV